jgi:hypothetical protein
MQTSRYENMALKNSEKASVKAVQKNQVEVMTNINEYSGGSKSVAALMRGIMAGKGRVVSAPNVTREDGGMAPSGVNPTHNIKDLSPIVNNQTNVTNVGSLQSVQAAKVEQRIENQSVESANKARAELLNLNAAASAPKPVATPAPSPAPTPAPKVANAVNQYAKQVKAAVNNQPDTQEVKAAQEGNSINVKV